MDYFTPKSVKIHQRPFQTKRLWLKQKNIPNISQDSPFKCSTHCLCGLVLTIFTLFQNLDRGRQDVQRSIKWPHGSNMMDYSSWKWRRWRRPGWGHIAPPPPAQSMLKMGWRQKAPGIVGAGVDWRPLVGLASRERIFTAGASPTLAHLHHAWRHGGRGRSYCQGWTLVGGVGHPWTSFCSQPNPSPGTQYQGEGWTLYCNVMEESRMNLS